MTAGLGMGGCGKTSAVACPAGREGPHLKDRAAAACTTRAGPLTAASTRAATAGGSPGKRAARPVRVCSHPAVPRPARVTRLTKPLLCPKGVAA